jgi:hypothetical protein
MEVEINHSNVIKSASLKELASALSKAQAKLGAVHKGEQGYGYNYASLASTIETARPVLAEFGLSVSQLLGRRNSDGKGGTVTTLLMHESGEYLGSTSDIAIIDMKGCNEAQSSGASFSYLRRYSLQAILNMASEDNDVSSAGKPESKPAAKQESKPQANVPAKGGFGRAAKL